MNVRIRSGVQNKAVGSAAKNTVSQRKDGISQARPIANTCNDPRSVKPSRIKNAVNGPLEH